MFESPVVFDLRMFHTPLCPTDCEIRHHDVITSLQALTPRFSSAMNAAIFSPSRVTRGNNKDDFKKQVHKLLATGWKKDKNVPENSKDFQLPLLHLASMFGKYEAIDWLLNEENFDAALRSSSSNETALHLVARHLYKALLSESARLENMSISAKVSNFEKVVSLLIAKEVSLFWAKDGLNKETPFHILAKHLVAANFAEADSGIEDQCLAFYSKSFNVMLKLLLAEEDGRLSRKDLMQALSVRNGDGDTPLHIVARAAKHGYRVLKFLVKSLGSSDLLKLKNEKQLTVLNIVNECYPGHEKDLIVEEEGEKQLDPADFSGKRPRPKPSCSDEPDQGTADLVQSPSRSSSNPTRLSRNEPSLGRGSARHSSECAFHTEYCPGSCSSDCLHTMASCRDIIDTHTPLCHTDCDLQHHMLTCCVFNPSVVFRTDVASTIPIRFSLCLQSSFMAGWEKHMSVPDPLASLRFPLLHLVCMSGNLLAVTSLIRYMKFKLDVPTRTKETPLHLAARYFPLTYPDSKNSNFQQILNFLTDEDQGMLFKFDLKGDTVLHILAQCFNGVASKLQANSSDAPLDKSALVKQKKCYYKAMRACLLKLSDLQSSNKLCKKQICKLVHDRNSAGKTFLDILQGGPDRVTEMILQPYAKEMLPYCFGEESQHLVSSMCQSSCPCSSGTAASQSPDCGTQAGQTQGEGERSVQEPVSSSQSPPAEVHNSTADVSEPQLTHDQPSQVEVAPSSVLPRRPQAQVRSIQVLGQETTGNPSPQANAAQPVQHIPVVFIKQEPVDLQPDAQCFVTTNSPLEAHPPRQNAYIIHTGTTVTTPVPSPAPRQSFERRIIHRGDHSPSNPSSLQSLLQCVQAVSNVTTTRNQPSTAATQTPILAQQGVQTVRTPTVNNPSSACTQTTALPQQRGQMTQTPSVNQPLTAGSQTTALPQQGGQTAQTPSVNQASTTGTQTTALLPQGAQTTRTPSVNQSPHGQTASKNPSRIQELPQAKQVQGKRKSAESVKEMALETLSKYNTDYKLEFFHTPLCYENCSIDHHHLILALLSSSNRLISRGSLNSFTQLLETTKVNFLKCVKKNLDEGFAKDLDISDGLVVLKYPLIHLAGMFFKYTAIDLLVHLGFERNPRSPRTGELPLHSTLRHGFSTGLKLYKSFAMNRNYEKLFSRVFKSFSSETDVIELLSQQDKNGDTPLHIAAKRMIERPTPLSKPSNNVTSEIPDSTQECESSSSNRGAPADVSLVCKLNPPSEQHRCRADFYIHCLEYILRKVQEAATSARKVNIGLVKPLFLTKNNEGETFLQIMCKEHHIANMAINEVLNRFPHVTFVDCVKQSVPEPCWPYTCLLGGPFVEEESTSGVFQNGPVYSPMELSRPSDTQSDAQPSKPQSPQPSSDVNLTQVSPSTSSASSVIVVAQESTTTPSTATPMQMNSALVSPTSASNTSDLLDSVLTPVVANPGHATLRPNTKRKIIEALREDYTERLELAVKGRREVEEDILKHRSKTEELAEVMAKKREEMQKLERELQELQKEMWHKNQAIQALENSLEQFSKEEEELGRNLAVLQVADPEPPTKKSKTQDSESSEQDTGM